MFAELIWSRDKFPSPNFPKSYHPRSKITKSLDLILFERPTFIFSRMPHRNTEMLVTMLLLSHHWYYVNNLGFKYLVCIISGHQLKIDREINR